MDAWNWYFEERLILFDPYFVGDSLLSVRILHVSSTGLRGFFQCKLRKELAVFFICILRAPIVENIFGKLLTKSYCLRNWVPQSKFKSLRITFYAHCFKDA